METSKTIIDKNGSERVIHQSSLENLKLGAQARYQDKRKLNLTLLPETIQWLKASGNASKRVDDLAAAAQAGRLQPDDGQPNEMAVELGELREMFNNLQRDAVALDRDLDRCVRQKMELQDQVKGLTSQLEKMRSVVNSYHDKASATSPRWHIAKQLIADLVKLMQ